MKYSFSKKGFFDENNPDIPSDSISISDEYWSHLINEQLNGAWIIHNEGSLPTLEYPNASQEQNKIQEYEFLRGQAYRNESDPIFFKAQRGEATHQEWLDKVAEIKLRYKI